MFTSHFKKRSIHITNRKVMESFKNDSESRPRTVVWEEAPEWQQDNEYILTGYRPGNTSYSRCFRSLINAHNETCNIYTHLIGALILPFVAINTFQALSKPRFPNVSGMDYVTLGTFFFSAECCLVFSTAFHLVGCHSRTVEQFWLRMDLLGIVAVTVGTSVPGIYYVFACEPSLQRLHWSVITGLGLITAASMFVPRLRRWRTVRTCAFLALGASTTIPALHGIQLYGLKYMLEHSGLRWYLLELAIYAGGVGMYAYRSPERFAPGMFDIWGSSHQIFHVAVLCAMYTHVIALMEAFTAHHTLDLCAIQAAL
ncbi:hypothetical protein D6C77_10315 [Aureobasidium pullulans]|nr:hypothetical protein D6C77_10315 [Aureobasidium pullulans]